MSDVNEWLKERRVYADFSPGHWIRSGHDIYCPDDGEEIAEWAYLSDAEAVVDAHNTLPSLLTAVEKVLELHKPVPIYDVEAGDCEHGEDCVGIELEPSETYCPDHIAYYSCECMMDTSSPDEFPEYPCPTVRAAQSAIEGAIK